MFLQNVSLKRKREIKKREVKGMMMMNRDFIVKIPELSQ